MTAVGHRLAGCSARSRSLGFGAGLDSRRIVAGCRSQTLWWCLSSLLVCGGKFLELEDVIVRNLCLNFTFESES